MLVEHRKALPLKTVTHPVEPAQVEARPAPLWHRAFAFVVKAVVAVLLLAAAGYYARDIMLSAPQADRRDRPRIARLVEVVEIDTASSGPSIEAWGEVVPARRLSLRAEVGGTVTELNPDLIPGGRVEEGEVLFRLDDRTLRLDLARAEAAIRQIEARIALEEGQQERARRDLERVPTKLTEEQRALVLRAPQMEELEAELAAARAARDAAGIALGKTQITAPFDAVVVSEELAPGAAVAANAEVAVLVGTERFRVELAVPPAALEWVDPTADAPVRLTKPEAWGDDWRTATVQRVAPELTATGRMAELILSVTDPLAQEPGREDRPELLLGSFVRAELEAPPIPGAVALERAYLRDDDRVWVMGPDDRLEIRDVRVAWRGTDSVLITEGLAPGERVVTTHLATVADGMQLRLGDRSDAGQAPLAERSETRDGAADGASSGG